MTHIPIYAYQIFLIAPLTYPLDFFVPPHLIVLAPNHISTAFAHLLINICVTI